MSIDLSGGSSEPRQQLGLIQAKAEKAALVIYPLLEKYLSTLRIQLEPATLQAVFQLVTQHHPEVFNNLSDQERLVLRARLKWLSGKCLEFLSNEKLLNLAIKLQAHDPEPQQLDLVSSEYNDPPGSISLSMELAPLMEGFNPNDFSQKNIDDPRGFPAAIDALRQIFEISSLRAAKGIKQPFPMPNDPVGLHHWLLAWDYALTRRLRNLSNALNVELFRHGMGNQVLPIALLDAVIEGGADALTAPANLLAVRLPYPLGEDSEIALHGVLLRSSDMEYLHPTLRTIRARINQIRTNLLRMARRSQHLHQQLAIRKAEQQWMEDNRQN